MTAQKIEKDSTKSSIIKIAIKYCFLLLLWPIAQKNICVVSSSYPHSLLGIMNCRKILSFIFKVILTILLDTNLINFKKYKEIILKIK